MHHRLESGPGERHIEATLPGFSRHPDLVDIHHYLDGSEGLPRLLNIDAGRRGDFGKAAQDLLAAIPLARVEPHFHQPGKRASHLLALPEFLLQIAAAAALGGLQHIEQRIAQRQRLLLRLLIPLGPLIPGIGGPL